jgi:small-conductance mechanosensitive channel
MERRREIATTLSAVRRVAIVLAFVGGVAAVLAAADAFSTLGWSLLASAGAVTLILGFAARTLLANILASLQIALNGSAKIGDELLFKGYICHVERINFTYVQLRVWTGERLVVPVIDFVEEIYENWTLQDGSLTRKIELKLAPEADLPAIRDLYHKVLDEGEWTLADPMHRGVHVTGQDVFGIDVLFRVPTVDAQESWMIACDVQERLVAEIVRLERARGAAWFPDARAAEAA